ncbi:unnamed protein product [Ilex paraguariensis]|uniref:Fe2OG dioxygenase domain-containing protein n=1 Tax=Ilex paraguariensis TaxID=185542 RepID=A0ABC8UWE2_9AQUA
MGSDVEEIAREEQDVPTYAASIPVPNVQEMVKGDPSHIPERYVRNQEDMPKTTYMKSLSSKIPVIDLSLLSNGHEEELKKLDQALKEWGFFQVVNHGVSERVLQEQKLDWSDALILVTFPSKFRRLKFWPSTPKDLKEIIETYSTEVRRVAEELLGSISFIMGMEKNTLLTVHKEMIQALRINYYPHCPKPDEVLGISPHSDASTITILLQEDDLNGLQISHGGEWVPVEPISNALVVNVGDVSEIWSNGKYKSIEHTAVTNENKARISCIISLPTMSKLDHWIIW